MPTRTFTIISPEDVRRTYRENLNFPDDLHGFKNKKLKTTHTKGLHCGSSRMTNVKARGRTVEIDFKDGCCTDWSIFS
jgi:hypothetical protein